MTIRSCAIIGSGTAAFAVGPALKAAGVDIISVSGRNFQRVEVLARLLDATPSPVDGIIGLVDLVLLAVPDAAIEQAASAIHLSGHIPPVVAHLSGARRLDPLAPHPRRAKMHPVASLSGGPERLAGAVWGIETDPDTVADVTNLVERLGGIPIDTRHTDLELYHLAAVFASNFLLAVLAASTDLWDRSGAPLPAAEALIPLARTALDNWAALGLENALTGPIARGDTTAVAEQLRTMRQQGMRAEELYRTLAMSAAELAARSPGRDQSAIAEIARMLAESRVLN